MKKQNFYKKNKGITIIALVVTIIVLLIMAGIVILMLIGENGLINKAIKAKEDHAKKGITENLNLVLTGILQDQIINTEGLSKEKSLTEFSELGYSTYLDESNPNDKKCYIIEEGYIYEIKEDTDGSQEVIFVGKNNGNVIHVHTPGPAATCTEPQVCTVCGEEISPKLPHTPGDPATCSSAQVCTVCGTEISPKLPHTPGDPATCTTAQVCTVCGEEISPKLPHTPGPAATCSEPQVCTVCGEEITETIGHSFTSTSTDSIHLKESATCQTPAIYYKSCEFCGANGTETFTSGSKGNHSFTSTSTDSSHLKTAANCQSAPVYYKSCSICGANGTETFTSGSTGPHTYSTTFSNKDSNQHGKCCTVCNNAWTDLSKHSWGTTAYPYGSSTSQYKKYHFVKCTGCGGGKNVDHSAKSYEYSSMGSNGHVITSVCACGVKYSSTTGSHGSWTYTWNKSTASPKHSKKCGKCSYYENISCNTNAPCTAQGYNANKKCSSCGYCSLHKKKD